VVLELATKLNPHFLSLFNQCMQFVDSGFITDCNFFCLVFCGDCSSLDVKRWSSHGITPLLKYCAYQAIKVQPELTSRHPRWRCCSSRSQLSEEDLRRCSPGSAAFSALGVQSTKETQR